VSYDLKAVPATWTPDFGRSRRQALQGRADVLAALSDYAASESALQLEVAKQYPDVHLNTGYEYDQGCRSGVHWGSASICRC